MDEVNEFIGTRNDHGGTLPFVQPLWTRQNAVGTTLDYWDGIILTGGFSARRGTEVRFALGHAPEPLPAILCVPMTIPARP